jgi:transcriptional antiterminator NusG
MSSAHWYVIHVAANNEKRVAVELKAQFAKAGLESILHDVRVPKKMVNVLRRGVRVQAEDRVLPGYVLVQMQEAPEAFHIIRSHPRVIGLLGADAKGNVRPLGPDEAEDLLMRVESMDQAARESLIFEIGEHVRVCDGLFASMEGVVEEVDGVRGRLKVSIAIFGRATPVDLDFNQVEKL